MHKLVLVDLDYLPSFCITKVRLHWALHAENLIQEIVMKLFAPLASNFVQTRELHSHITSYGDFSKMQCNA